MNKVVRSQVRRRIGTIQGLQCLGLLRRQARQIVFVEGRARRLATASCRHRDATASRSARSRARDRWRASRHGPSRDRRTRRRPTRSTMKLPGCVSASATARGCTCRPSASAMPRMARSSSAISAREPWSGTALSRKRMALSSMPSSVSRNGLFWRGMGELAGGNGKAWISDSVSAMPLSSSGRRGARPSMKSTTSTPPGNPARGSITSCSLGVRPAGAR